MLTNVGDPSAFTRFTRLLAGRAGQLVNTSALGSDAGISQPTAKRWLSILEASYVIAVLRPHFRNFGKRLIKSPKVYFLDTGLLCRLLGLRRTAELESHPLRCAIFEDFVFVGMQKRLLHDGGQAPLCFCRDSRDHEVGLLVEGGPRCVPIEVQDGVTVPSDALREAIAP